MLSWQALLLGNVLKGDAHGVQVTPVFYDDGVSYCYITHSNLVLMTVSRANANAAATLLFLHKLRDILTAYFGELEEESLRDNFVIAYELLDEARPS